MGKMPLVAAKADTRTLVRLAARAMREGKVA